MKLLLCSILFAAFLLPAQAADCPSHQGKEADILVQIEQSWAAALELRDADAVGCILADEFQDVDPNGAASQPRRNPGANSALAVPGKIF